VITVMVAITLFHVGIMLRLATNGMDFGPLAANYLGLFLLAGLLLALGVLTSTVTENQVVAAFLGIMLIMLLWFLGLAEQIMGTDSAVGQFLGYAGLSEHYLNFGQGVLDTRDVVYMVSLTVGALFLATRILESRRWR
jgi:ABC-2 type transport system permease protein